MSYRQELAKQAPPERAGKVAFKEWNAKRFGIACAEVDCLCTDLAAARAEAERAKAGKLEITASIGVHPDSDYHDLANRFLGMKHGRQDDRIALEASESRCATLAAECESLRADKARLDWLDKEMPEVIWRADATSVSLSHFNWLSDTDPVTDLGAGPTIRAAIDAARADAARKEPPAKAHGCEVGE